MILVGAFYLKFFVFCSYSWKDLDILKEEHIDEFLPVIQVHKTNIKYILLTYTLHMQYIQWHRFNHN